MLVVLMPKGFCLFWGFFAHFLVSDDGAIDTIVLWDIIALRGLLLADQRLEELVRLCVCESPQ